MSTSITEQLVAESGLPADAVTELEPLVSALRDLTPDSAPTPSPALAALLADPPRLAPPRSRRRLAVLGSAAAVLSSLTVTGVAAAANELPEPAQRFVADLSERYLPFHFPQPRNGATKVDPEQTPERIAPTDPGFDVDPSGPGGSAVPSGDPSGLPTPSQEPSGRPSQPVGTPTASGAPSGEPAPSGAASAQPTDTIEPTPVEPDADVSGGDPRVGTDPDAEPVTEPTAPATSAASEPTGEPTADATAGPTGEPAGESGGGVDDGSGGAEAG